MTIHESVVPILDLKIWNTKDQGPVIQELIFQETKDLAKTVPERRE